MKLNVGHKLFLAVLTVVGLVVAAMVGITSLSLRQGYSSFVGSVVLERQNALVQRLEAMFAATGDWSALEESPATWTLLLRESFAEPRPTGPQWPPREGSWPETANWKGPPPKGPPPKGIPPPRFDEQLTLVAADERVIAGEGLGSSFGGGRRPLSVGGKVVGHLVFRLPAQGNDMISVDPDRLRQLFANLLENTLRYTHAGGTLKICCVKVGRSVAISFEDSAPGVEPSALPLLFDRFFRTDGSRQRALGGSGLGLAICKSIVSAHEGSIAARASDLGGLCIEITLPLLEETA